MARYIDADALLRDIYRNPEGDSGERCAQILEAILSAPTADVAPRAEVAREIFEEIEKIIKSPRTVGFCMTAPSFRQAISDYNEGIRKEILYYIAELKKKYTEEN